MYCRYVSVGDSPLYLVKIFNTRWTIEDCAIERRRVMHEPVIETYQIHLYFTILELTQ